MRELKRFYRRSPWYRRPWLIVATIFGAVILLTRKK